MIADSVQLLYIQYEMSRFMDVKGVKKPNFSGLSSLNAIHPTPPWIPTPDSLMVNDTNHRQTV